jgi:hypothetical protein
LNASHNRLAQIAAVPIRAALLPAAHLGVPLLEAAPLLGQARRVNLGDRHHRWNNQSTPANSKGIIMFDAGGRYVEVNGDPSRPKFKSAGRPTGEELAAATLGHFAANFGTWSANEADKTITRHYEIALRPNNEGTDLKNFVTLTGDELKLSGVVPSTGAKIDYVYRRAK